MCYFCCSKGYNRQRIIGSINIMCRISIGHLSLPTIRESPQTIYNSTMKTIISEHQYSLNTDQQQSSVDSQPLKNSKLLKESTYLGFPTSWCSFSHRNWHWLPNLIDEYNIRSQSGYFTNHTSAILAKRVNLLEMDSFS